MRKLVTLVFTFYFTFFQVEPAFAAKQKRAEDSAPVDQELLSNQIEASVYSIKKTKYYVAVELGFHNPTDSFIEFTPKEIYLDDAVKYSKQPLTVADIQKIEEKKPGLSLLPVALGIGLGIAAIGTGIFNEDAASKGLTIAALSMGGAYILTKGLENQAKARRLLTFENNSLTTIKRLPPGMTLGGFLYFPATKAPKSITIIAKSKNGRLEKKVFDIEGVQEPQKAKKRQMQRD